MAKCILVVDDEPVNLELVKRTLLARGFDVLSARDGLEALEMLAKNTPDLIILDVQMPNLDGYGFIIKKNADPAIAAIPIVVLTAMGKTEPLFRRHRIKDYLLKPINTQDLVDKIQDLLK